MNHDLRSHLERSAARMATAFAADPQALARAYAPGKWPARTVLLHIVDVESVFHDRLKRALADAKPLYWGIDPDRWTARLAYPGRSLAIAARLFTAQREALVELLAAVEEHEWERTGIHSEYGRLTLSELAARVAGHANHHLDQVEAAIAGRIWTAAS